MKKYIEYFRSLAPYLKKSAVGTTKELAIGLGLTSVGLVAIGAIHSGLSSLPEPQYNVWQVERRGESIVAEKRVDMLGYTRLTDDDGDGIIDRKYISGLPRPGCFGHVEPSSIDQKVFEQVIKEL